MNDEQLNPREMELTSRACFPTTAALLSFSLIACMTTNGESVGAAPATQFSKVIEVPGTAEELTNRFFSHTGPVLSKQVHGNTVQLRVSLTCETRSALDRAIAGNPEYSADVTIESKENRARVSMSNFIMASSVGTYTLEHMVSVGNPHDCSDAFQRFANDLAATAASAASDDW